MENASVGFPWRKPRNFTGPSPNNSKKRGIPARRPRGFSAKLPAAFCCRSWDRYQFTNSRAALGCGGDHARSGGLFLELNVKSHGGQAAHEVLRGSFAVEPDCPTERG